jgi:hypothetical protein
MNRNKHLSVFWELVWGTLPSYLIALFWEQSNRNPIVLFCKRKMYTKAVSKIIAHCGCVRWEYPKGDILEFPETLDQLKELVDCTLVKIASERIACERTQHLADRDVAKNHFGIVFDSAKVLGLIDQTTTFAPYFTRGEIPSRSVEERIRMSEVNNRGGALPPLEWTQRGIERFGAETQYPVCSKEELAQAIAQRKVRESINFGK